MSAITELALGLDPRHVFLARDVMARYGWGKTKGYRNARTATSSHPR